ncbi:hypothetical protein JZ751_009421, partial [Albula glossodonta]
APGSMLKGEYVTTYRDDFRIPALAQQKTELGKRKPLIRPYPEKRDIPTHPCKEKRVTSPRPGRDMGGASAGQKRGAPPRPAQEKKVAPLPVKDKLTSPQPVGKVAPTRPDQKVTLPPHNLPKAPEPDPEGRTSPLHLVRKVAPARPFQKVALPNHDEMEEKAKNGSCPGLSPNCFVFHKVLGKGAFGKVMLAELKESGEHFAVKSLRKDHILINGHVECTKVERRVLALASESPFLTHLHSTFQTKVMIQTHATHLHTCHLSEDNNTYSPTHLYSRHLDKGNAPCPHEYFTFPTKYVRGRDLYFYIVEKGHFERHTAEDLKLSNVMLDGEGHVKIVDFGLCKDKLLDGKAMSFCGTEQYIAPEIFQGQEYSFEVDWWSLGVLIYEMLTGDSPFQGDNNDELSVSVCTDIPEYPSWIDLESKDLMEKLMEKNPTLRLGAIGDIRAHPFFSATDWTALEKKEVEPPFKPQMGNSDEDSLLDQFLSEESDLEVIRLAQCTSNREEVVGDLGPHLFRSFRTAVATEKRETASESKLKGGESREEHCGEPWAATKAGRRGKEALK